MLFRSNLIGSFSLKDGLKGELDNLERWFSRLAIGILEVIVVYSVIVGILNRGMNKKIDEVQDLKMSTQSEIAKADRDLMSIKEKTTWYSTVVQNLKNADALKQQSDREKDRIPQLLTNIMYSIPQGVTVTSIENQTDMGGSTGNDHVIISAQSTKYDLLGYFVGVLKDDTILRNIVSTSGTNVDGTVKIVIEGDLP